MNPLVFLSEVYDKVVERHDILELELEEKIILTCYAKYFFDVGMGKERIPNILCRLAENQHKNYKSLADGVVIELEGEALDDFVLTQSSDALMDSRWAHAKFRGKITHRAPAILAKRGKNGVVFVI